MIHDCDEGWLVLIYVDSCVVMLINFIMFYLFCTCCFMLIHVDASRFKCFIQYIWINVDSFRIILISLYVMKTNTNSLDWLLFVILSCTNHSKSLVVLQLLNVFAKQQRNHRFHICCAFVVKHIKNTFNKHAFIIMCLFVCEKH